MGKRTIYFGIIVFFAASFLTGRHFWSSAPNSFIYRMKEKAKEAQVYIKRRARDGGDVSVVIEEMGEIRALLDKKEFTEAEARLDAVLVSLSSGEEIGSLSGSDFDGPATNAFANPRRVEIRGYGGSAMEPFITRDGKYLLFNSAKDAFGTGNVKPDLHLARKVDEVIFEYIGELEGANSEAFDGAPTVDNGSNVYFSSTRRYKDELSILHVGTFKDGKVSGVELVRGDISKKKGGWLNMDAEISADGNTLYFADTTWDTENNIPKTSDLQIARRTGGSFRRIKDSDTILENVNSDELEYAAAVSNDELELFFTRTKFKMNNGKLAGVNSRIMMATRNSTTDPFSAPKRIADIKGFVEGPTISSDGQRLYYHKKEEGDYRLYMVSRQ